MARVAFTHKGWFGVCPCYFADVDAESPIVVPRWYLLEPLVLLSAVGFALWQTLRWMVNRNAKPSFPLVFTGELNPPIVRSVVMSR